MNGGTLWLSYIFALAHTVQKDSYYRAVLRKKKSSVTVITVFFKLREENGKFFHPAGTLLVYLKVLAEIYVFLHSIDGVFT